MRNDLIFQERINVTQPKLPNYERYTEVIKEIWEEKWLTNDGPLHERFRGGMKEYLNVPNGELFTNGHLALEIAIKSLDLKGEIITTPFTFASTTHAITNCGLTPVFCDIDQKTYNIDANKIESLITPKTSAIVAVHVFGTPCDVDKINQIAKKYNLKVIYDAAHAFGVEIDGIGIGNFGDISMFSLHATKVFHSIEGGILTYQDESLTPVIKALKNFGITSPESVDYVGTNAKMNEFQAAMGLCNLETITEDIQKRSQIHKTYVEGLSAFSPVSLLPFQDNVKANHAYFPILLKDKDTRDFLHMKLQEYNVFSRKYFYPLCNDFNCYGSNSETTPVGKGVSDTILCLPMYSELDLSDVKKITEIIKVELGEMNGK